MTLTATNLPGWTFLNWAGSASGTNNPLTLTLDGNQNVQAIFGTTLGTAVLGGGANGSIQANPMLSFYPYGSTVELSAVPATTSLYFQTWGGAANGNTVSPLNFVVTNASPTVTAKFSTLPTGNYSLTLLTAGPGTVSNSPQASYYASGTVVTLTATPSAGYVFTGWSGGATGTMDPLNVTMNSSMTITANFGTNPPVQLFPPTVAITAPSSGATYTAPTNVSVNATASDANSNGFVTQVAFFNRAAQVTILTNAPYNFTWSNAPIGSNVLTAIATDNSSLSSTSAPVSIIVQPSVPLVALTTPTNGSSFLTNVSIVINGLMSDADGDLAQVDLYAEATTNGAQPFLLSAFTNPPYNSLFNYTWSNVPPGSYLLTAQAVDSYGPMATSTPVNVTISVAPATNPPVFVFSTNNYYVNESDGSVVVTVLNTGNLGGFVNYTTEDGTAYGGSGFSGSYTINQGSLTFASGQRSTNITIGIIDNYRDAAPVYFSVQLFDPSTGTVGTPSTATVNILLNDVGGATNSLFPPVAPSAPPPTSGALTVVLTPSAANGQWRFPWQLGWNQSGQTESNLQAGNYPVEFQNVSNYLAYPPTVTVPVTNGGITTVTNQYFPTFTSSSTNSTGSLTVEFGQNAPADAAWQLFGQSGSLSNNATITGLLPDTYFIEFTQVTGYSSPAAQAVQVFGGQQTVVQATYLLPSSLPAGVDAPMSPVPLGNITDIVHFPYEFNGQLLTDVGYGSGVAVRKNVVLTAAHMVFNDATLSYVNQAYWWCQQEEGVFSPEPLPARGWYVLSGYAAQRTNDLKVRGYGIDQPSPQSEDMDVAALYFLSLAARGGYGGYLASDVSPNPYLTGSSLKMLVGYPVDGSEFGQTVTNGTMYEGPTEDAALDLSGNQTYTASWFISYPGNSGGPLYVQFTDGKYYPAAVYLGTLGSGQNSVSVVRAINSEVVNLIGLAASLGDQGTNNSGGGVITLIAGAASTNNPAYVQVLFGPPEIMSAGAGWRIAGTGDSSYGTTSYIASVTSSNAMLEFKPIPGWNSPPVQTNQVNAGSLNIISNAQYSWIAPILSLSTQNGITLTGSTGTTYILEYTTNLSSGRWVPINTNTVSRGSIQLLPWPPTNGPAAYYRVAWLP